MSYLYFHNMIMPNRPYPINESLSTMGRQFIDDFCQLFNFDNWTSSRASDMNFLQSKLDYFNKLFYLSPQLKKDLLSWVKKTPNVFSLPRLEMDQFLGTISTETRTGYRTTSNGQSVPYTYEENRTNALSLQLKGRNSNAVNSITNATCLYRLVDDKSDKEYIVIFTFDSDEIKSCQVVIKSNYQSSSFTGGFDVVELHQWDGVDPKEYTR